MPPMSAPPIPKPTTPAPTTPTDFVAEELTFTLPPGWQAVPGTGMRFATILSPQEIPFSVIRLSGDGGGILMNINRWRGQIMLPPLTQDQLNATVTTSTPNGITVILADIQSEKGRILGAVIPSGKSTLFFKAQVESPTQIDPLREAFIAIANSAKPTK